MFQFPPVIEPVCFVQYESGAIQDLTAICGQLEKQQKQREEIEQNMTPEQRQLLEQQKRQLEEERVRSRKTFDDLIRQRQQQNQQQY